MWIAGITLGLVLIITVLGIYNAILNNKDAFLVEKLDDMFCFYDTTITTIVLVSIGVFLTFAILGGAGKSVYKKYGTKEAMLQAKQMECELKGEQFDPDGYLWFSEKSVKNYDNGFIIGLYMPVVTIIVLAIGNIISLYQSRLKRDLKKIEKAMEKCRPTSHSDPTLDQAYEILRKTKKKIEFQMAFAEVMDGIKAAKRIQKSDNHIDIQAELDELQSFYELSNIEMENLIKKYEGR